MENGKKLFKFLLNFRQIQTYESFDLFMEKVISLSNELSKNFKDEYKSYLSEENSDEDFLDSKVEEMEVENQSYNSELYKSLIILFYSETEIKLKEILKLHCFVLEKSKGKRQFVKIDSSKYEDLEKRFQEKMSLKLSEFESSDKVSEIRLLNNCLKHSGKVSKELAKANQIKWKKKGEPIVLELDYIEQLITSSKKFMINLVKEILEENK